MSINGIFKSRSTFTKISLNDIKMGGILFSFVFIAGVDGCNFVHEIEADLLFAHFRNSQFLCVTCCVRPQLVHFSALLGIPVFDDGLHNFPCLESLE